MEKMTPGSLRNAIHQVAGDANAPHTPPHLMMEGTAKKPSTPPADALSAADQQTIANTMQELIAEAQSVSSTHVKKGKKKTLFHLGKIASKLQDAADTAGDKSAASDLNRTATSLIVRNR